MAKLVLAMFISVDGYIEGPNGQFVPPAWSNDFERHWPGYALANAGHLVYGRTNFLFNRDFWSAAETDPDSPAAAISHAPAMNRLPKTVISRTLSGNPGWNATLVKEDLAGAIGRLKLEGGKDVYAFGGAGLANSLIRLDQDLVQKKSDVRNVNTASGPDLGASAGFQKTCTSGVSCMPLKIVAL